MSVFDVRTDAQEIKKILFAEGTYLSSSLSGRLYVEDASGAYVAIRCTDLQNLKSAVDKAISLGWGEAS